MNPTMKTLLSPLLLLIQESRQSVQSSPGILRQPGRPRRGLPVMVVQVGRIILCINRESASPVLTIAYRVTPTPCISASIQRYIHRRENRHRVTVTNRSLHRSYWLKTDSATRWHPVLTVPQIMTSSNSRVMVPTRRSPDQTVQRCRQQEVRALFIHGESQPLIKSGPYFHQAQFYSASVLINQIV